MAYAVNGFVRKSLNNKVSLYFILDDSDGMFNDFQYGEGFIMTHITNQTGSPVLIMNGEKISLPDWAEKAEEAENKKLERDFDKERRKQSRKKYNGYTISQLSTAAIWICKKVKDYL